MREFSVLLLPAAEAKGQWVAHCLNWDLISQGDSPGHAVLMMMEAIVLVLEEDASEGLDPAKRPSAPYELWEMFQKVQHQGTRISPADVDAPSTRRADAIAVVLYCVEKPLEGGVADGSQIQTPPPFVIAAIEENHQPSC